MPVLRMAPDNTLAETLGNLGQSLTRNFNPLAQMQAYQLQQRMFLEQEQLREQQRKNAAQYDAVRHFAQFVPQEYLPMVATMIYQNAPWDQIVRHVAMWSGHLIDADTPEALAKNIEFMRQIDSSYSYQKDGPPVGGRVTADAFDRWKAAQAGASAQATAAGTMRGQQEASAPYISQLVDDASPAGIQKNIDVIERWEGKPYDYSTRGPPVKGSATQAAFDDWKIKQGSIAAGENARSTEVGKQIGGGITPSGQLYPFGLPGSPTNPFPTATSPAPSTPAPAPTSTTPNVSISNPANPSATPTPITRQTTAGVVVGQTAPEATQTAALDKATRDNLQEAIDAGVAAVKLKSITARIRALADAAGTGGPEQLPTAVVQKLADMGFRFTKRSEILAEMDSLFKAQIPELRKDMGVKFEAGPELSAQSKMVGTSTLPPAVLNGILARQDAIADLGIQRRELAQRAIGQNPDNPLPVTDYYREENKLYDQLPQHTQELLRLYGANAAPNAATPVTTQGGAPSVPAPNAGDAVSNALSNFVHWFTGGYGQAQPPAPAPGPGATPDNSVEIKPNPDGTFPDAPR